MPAYLNNPEDQIRQIQGNLRDRYKTRLSILKELFQNADDAVASDLFIDLRGGRATASHPLLRGQGILVINNGRFTSQHQRGISTLSASSKSEDVGSAGRFGLGQKSVFHVCDAFIAVPLGRNCEIPPFIVSPFNGLDATKALTDPWEDVGGVFEDVRPWIDDALLERHGLALWLPLRRKEIRPLAGFDNWTAEQADLISELAQLPVLSTILAAARNLRRLEIRNEGRAVISLARDGTHLQLLTRESLVAQAFPEEAPFGGVVVARSGETERTSPFRGREAMGAGSDFEALRSSDAWPTSYGLDGRPVPEKAVPHGAAVLVRHENKVSRLSIYWGVFLPTGEMASTEIQIAGGPEVSALNLDLFLHGYFFVDSGRQSIEGLAGHGVPGSPSAETRWAWNRRVRDDVTLPMLPDLFVDALEAGLLSSSDVRRVVRSLNTSFGDHRPAITSRNHLAEVWDGQNLAWRAVPATKDLRPIPSSVLTGPDLLGRLFPGLASSAAAKGIALAAVDGDSSTVLSNKSPAWSADELAALVESMPVLALARGGVAEALHVFLDLAAPLIANEMIGRALRRKLREALKSEGSFQGGQALREVLRHAPDRLFLGLPEDALNMEILAVLAATDAGPLVVRRSWLTEGHRPRISDEAELAAMLLALQPLAVGAQADRAARAALELIRASGRELSALARNSAFRDLAIFPVTVEPSQEKRLLSLGELDRESGAGRLFRRQGLTNVNLKAVLRALPALQLYLTNDSELLQALPGFKDGDENLDAERAVGFVNIATHFAEVPDRKALLELVTGKGWTDTEDFSAAARRLLVGVAEAGPKAARVYWCEDADLAVLVGALLDQSRRHDAFVADAELIGSLSPQRRKRIDLRDIAPRDLELLLEEALTTGNFPTVTLGQAELLLATDLPTDLVRRLPIHKLESGGFVAIDESVCLASERPVPHALRQYLRRVQRSVRQAVSRRQEELIPTHDTVAELKAALRTAEPAKLANIILNALADPALPAAPESSVTGALASTEWLTVASRTVSPRDILFLPDAVSAAAKAVLGPNQLAWQPQAMLAPAIRDHKGFPVLAKLALPDLDKSLELLALQIDGAGLIGLPVRCAGATEEISRDLAILAGAGANFDLPGWRLAAALLGPDVADSISGQACLDAFRPIALGDTDAFGGALDVLSQRSEGNGRVAEAARRLSRRAFEDLGEWSPQERQALFARVQVLTAEGTARPGRAVARDGNGIAPAQLLDPGLADILRRMDRDMQEAGKPSVDAAAPRTDRRLLPSDLAELDRLSAQGHRAFLDSFRNRIPAELALTYLALIGRFSALDDLVDEWAKDSNVSYDVLLDKVDQEINHALNGVTLESELAERRLLVQRVTGPTVEAISLAGATFAASTSGATAVLIGNRHSQGEKHRLANGHELLVYTLPLQHDLRDDQASRSIESFRNLVQTIARDCLWLSSGQQRNAVGGLLNRFSETSQVLLDQTRSTLLDRLPGILKPLKPGPEKAIGRALKAYEDAESRGNVLEADADHRTRAKRQLWNDTLDEQAAVELLELTRARMNDLGYDNRRVVLELFQNADDATLQLGDSDSTPSFRLAASGEGLRVVHWGRPINHRGPDPSHGGDGGDLINMLVLNYSNKHAEQGVTGKYGLGFKSVHGLTDSVGVASGLIAIRTKGGLLPVEWPEGAAQLRAYQKNGVPTLIDVPFASGREAAGRDAIENFSRVAPYLPLFAKAVRHIAVETSHGAATHYRQESVALPGVPGVLRITLAGSSPFSALMFALGDGYRLVAKLGDTGLVPFGKSVPRLWSVAPLDQILPSGWLLDGPFRVTPSRAELHGDTTQLFQSLGHRLGQQLLNLHQSAEANWDAFAEALGLDGAVASPSRFWGRLWDLFRRDLENEVARELHNGGGLAALAGGAEVVPSGLEPPHASLVLGSAAKGYFAEALEDDGLRQSIAQWPSVTSGGFVTHEIARDLDKLGVHSPRPTTMTTVVATELALLKHRIDVRAASRLGGVLSQPSLEEHPLAIERPSVRTTVTRAQFLNAEGSWRPVSELTIPQATDGAERLRGSFAPAEHRLAEGYTEDALRFVELARAQSGYSPRPALLHGWAARAETPAERAAVLRYLISFDDREQLASLIRANPPSWMLPLQSVAGSSLSAGWTQEDRNHLSAVLRNYQPETSATPDVGADRQPTAPSAEVVAAIWDWWATVRDDEIRDYEGSVYPTGFDRQRLADRGDREAWFTLFALATFQSFGATQDGQHRTFVEEGTLQGWWGDLARSRPPENQDVWLDRLAAWSGDALPDLTHWRWRRALLDLYKIARWLPEYTRIVELLPRALGDRRSLMLSNALTPTYSPIWQQANIEAAPLVRTLGIGANWLLRECLRLGVYEAGAEAAVAPYTWATTARVRRLLNRVGANLKDEASMDASPAVWRFVEGLVADDHRQLLLSDLDLPLQRITLQRNSDAHDSCLFGRGALPASETGNDDDDSQEAAE